MKIQTQACFPEDCRIYRYKKYYKQLLEISPFQLLMPMKVFINFFVQDFKTPSQKCFVDDIIFWSRVKVDLNDRKMSVLKGQKIF